MKQIRKDIKENKLKGLYLLYGEEDFLRKQMRDEIKQAVVGEGESMNYAYYEGKKVEAAAVIDFADTMPFMAEKRLVVVENCDINSKAPDEWVEYLSHISDTTCIVLVERKVNKNTKFYKTCNKYGYAVDLDKQKKSALMEFISEWLEMNNCRMDKKLISYFLARVSEDMNLVERELEKLRDYCVEFDEEGKERGPVLISKEDIDSISVQTLEDKVFEMIGLAFKGNYERAIILFQDLLSLKQSPVQVHALIIRQVNILLQIKEYYRLRNSKGELVDRMNLSDYVLRINTPIAKGTSYKKLKYLLEEGAVLDTDIKRGRIEGRMAVELMLAMCSRPE